MQTQSFLVSYLHITDYSPLFLHNSKKKRERNWILSKGIQPCCLKSGRILQHSKHPLIRLKSLKFAMCRGDQDNRRNVTFRWAFLQPIRLILFFFVRGDHCGYISETTPMRNTYTVQTVITVTTGSWSSGQHCITDKCTCITITGHF